MQACVNPYCELHKEKFTGQRLYRKIINPPTSLFMNGLFQPNDLSRIESLIIDTKILKHTMQLVSYVRDIITFDIIICENCEKSLPCEILKIFKEKLTTYRYLSSNFVYNDSMVNELLTETIKEYYNRASFNRSKQWTGILLEKRSIINAPINPNVSVSKESIIINRHMRRHMRPRYARFYDVLPNDEFDTER